MFDDSEFLDPEFQDDGWPPDDAETDALPDAATLQEAALVHLESVAFEAKVAMARQYLLIADVLRDATADPTPWAGPDPTLVPDWVDPRGWPASEVRRERRDMARRAAVADVAVRLRMSETQVRTRADHAETMRTRCPELWLAFVSGQVCEQNAVCAAQLAATLPARDPESWAAFDAGIVGRARQAVPARFRMSARALRERVHPEKLEDRHRRAAADRGVWMSAELDGMATVSGTLPADKAHALYGDIDAAARRLARVEGETRTLAQLRADVLADLTPACPQVKRPKPSVAITVPVMTLLGRSDEPAVLHGYGPIDLDTTRRLAGEAKSWVRVLTHPVTGTVLDVDRKMRRVPAALRRWLGILYATCTFPGCTRAAAECDLDHMLDWQFGGVTADTNLCPLCGGHHHVRHKTMWTATKPAGGHEIVWTSPTGHTATNDPAPF